MNITIMFTKIYNCFTFLGPKPTIVDGLFECDISTEVKETPCFNCQNGQFENDKIAHFKDYKLTNIKHEIIVGKIIIIKNDLHLPVPSSVYNQSMNKFNIFKKPSFFSENQSEKVTYPKMENNEKLKIIENTKLEIKNAKLEERNKLLLEEIKNFKLSITQQEDKTIKLCQENSIIKNDFKNAKENLDYLKMLNENLTESNGNLLSLVKELFDKNVCKIQEKLLKGSDSCADKRNRDTLYECSWPNAPPKTSLLCANTTRSFTSKKNNENFSLKNDVDNFNEEIVCFKIKQFKMLSPYELSDNISISTFLEQFPKDKFSMCTQQEYCSIIHQFLGKELKDKMGQMGVIPCKTNYQDYLYHLYYLKVGLNVSEHDVLFELENLKLKGHNLLEKYEKIVNLVDNIDQDLWPENTKCRYIFHYCKKHLEKSLKPIFEMLYNEYGTADYPSRLLIKRFMVKNMINCIKNNLNTKQPKNVEVSDLNIVNDKNFEENYRKKYLKLKRKTKNRKLV